MANSRKQILQILARTGCDMKTFLDCIPCQMRQAIQAVRQISADDALAESVLRHALSLAAKIDYNQPPAMIGREIHALIRKETQNTDPYSEIKSKANNTALKVMSQSRDQILKADNPLQQAVKFAIAGNILDFAIYNGWDDNRFQKCLDDATKKYIDPQQMERLRSALEKADKILYLADNAGETIFDSLLIEQLLPRKIVYAVKSSPVINDALISDALIAGIDKLGTIITNGTDSAGTVLSICSQEFLNEFDNADLIIAKGQANYETLCDVKKNIFFLTQIKCQIIARDLQGNIGDWVITSSN
jgi:damage-control phosphatase, subfamily I